MWWYRIINRIVFGCLVVGPIAWFFTSDPANPRSGWLFENPFFVGGFAILGSLWGFTNAICWRRYQADLDARFSSLSQKQPLLSPWLLIGTFILTGVTGMAVLLTVLLLEK